MTADEVAPDQASWIGFQKVDGLATLAVLIQETPETFLVALACPDVLAPAPPQSAARHTALSRVKRRDNQPLLPPGLLDEAAFIPGTSSPGVSVTVVIDKRTGAVATDPGLKRERVGVTTALTVAEARAGLLDASHPQHRELGLLRAAMRAVRDSEELAASAGEPAGSSPVDMPEPERFEDIRELTILANRLLTLDALRRRVPIIFRNSRAVGSGFTEPVYEAHNRGHEQLGIRAYAHFFHVTLHLVDLINLEQILSEQPAYAKPELEIIAAHCNAVEIADARRIRFSREERAVLAQPGPLIPRLPGLSFAYLLMGTIDQIDWSAELQEEVLARLDAPPQGGALHPVARYAVLFLAPRPAWDEVCAAVMRWLAQQPERAYHVVDVVAEQRGWTPDLIFDEVEVGSGIQPSVMTRCRVTIDGHQRASRFHCGDRSAARAAAAADLLSVLANVRWPEVQEPFPALIAALTAGGDGPARPRVDVAAMRNALAYVLLGGQVPPAAAHRFLRAVTTAGRAAPTAFEQLGSLPGIPREFILRVEMEGEVEGGERSVVATAHVGGHPMHRSRRFTSPYWGAAHAAALGDVVASMLRVPPLDQSELAQLFDAIQVAAGSAAEAPMTLETARSYLKLAVGGTIDPARAAAVGGWLAASPSRALPLLSSSFSTDPPPLTPVRFMNLQVGPGNSRTYLAVAEVQLARDPSPRCAAAVGATPQEAREQAALMLAHDLLDLDRPPPRMHPRLLGAIDRDGTIPMDRLDRLGTDDVRDVLIYTAYGGTLGTRQALAVLSALVAAPAVARAALVGPRARSGPDVKWVTRLLTSPHEHRFASGSGSVQIGPANVSSEVHDGLNQDDLAETLAVDLCARILGLPPPPDPRGRLPEILLDPSLRVSDHPNSIAAFDESLAAAAHAGVISDALGREALLRMASRRVSRVSLYNLLFGADPADASWAALREQAIGLLTFRPELAFRAAEIAFNQGLWSEISTTASTTRAQGSGIGASRHTVRIQAVAGGTLLEVQAGPCRNKDEAFWRALVELLAATRQVVRTDIRGLGILEPSASDEFGRTLKGRGPIVPPDSGHAIG